MGTKADFYLGKNTNAQWLGSIAWDGHPWRISPAISTAKTEEEYRTAILDFLRTREDASFGLEADQHWPWPWDNSKRTHYSYKFENGKLLVSHFGGPWCDPADPLGYEFPKTPKQEFPDMTLRKLSIVGEKSGLVIVHDSHDKSVVEGSKHSVTQS